MTKPLELTLQFGTFPVIESSPSVIVLDLGNSNFFRLHVSSVPHLVKVGDRLPIFTRVPYGKPNN